MADRVGFYSMKPTDLEQYYRPYYGLEAILIGRQTRLEISVFLRKFDIK